MYYMVVNVQNTNVPEVELYEEMCTAAMTAATLNMFALSRNMTDIGPFILVEVELEDVKVPYRIIRRELPSMFEMFAASYALN